MKERKPLVMYKPKSKLYLIDIDSIPGIDPKIAKKIKIAKTKAGAHLYV
jgi:hypothetical protein